MRKALAINPNLVNASNWLSNALSAQGELMAALEMEENARQEVAHASRDFFAVVEKAAQKANQGLLTATATQPPAS